MRKASRRFPPLYPLPVLTLLVLIVMAAAAALVRGGSLEGLAATRFRWGWLIFAGLLLQVGLDLWSPPWLTPARGLTVVLASNVLIALFLLINRGLPGVGLAAAGMALNVVVIVANGAMPVSEEAAEAAAVGRPLDDASIKHERMTDETVLPWLGDVLPIPVLAEVLSVGDLVLSLGLARLVYVRTRAGQ